MNIYHVLESKGILLPSPPPKGGVYTPVKEFGDNFLYCSGCGPDLGNGNTIIGKLGDSLSIEDGQKAAYNCMLNLLANLHAKIGDLNKKLCKITCFCEQHRQFHRTAISCKWSVQFTHRHFRRRNGLSCTLCNWYEFTSWRNRM